MDDDSLEEIFLTPAHREQERQTLNQQIEQIFKSGGEVTQGPGPASSVDELGEAELARMLEECLPNEKRRKIEATTAYRRRHHDS